MNLLFFPHLRFNIAEHSQWPVSDHGAEQVHVCHEGGEVVVRVLEVFAALRRSLVLIDVEDAAHGSHNVALVGRRLALPGVASRGGRVHRLFCVHQHAWLAGKKTHMRCLIIKVSH